MVLLSKNYYDYRKCNKEEMIENFTLKNLDSKNVIGNKNNLTKSFIFAPFNSSYKNDEQSKIHLEENLNIENNLILFDENINILNRQYELNNNGEIDHGVLINRSKMSSSCSNRLIDGNKNTKREELKDKSKSKSKEKNNNEIFEEEEQIKKCNEINHKKLDNIDKEKENKIQKRNINIIKTNNDKITLDENIIKNMEKLGYQKNYVEKCILDNEINYCSATYYLLLNKPPEIFS